MHGLSCRKRLLRHRELALHRGQDLRRKPKGHEQGITAASNMPLIPHLEAHTCVKPSCTNPKHHNTKVTPYISAILREDLMKLLAVKGIPS